MHHAHRACRCVWPTRPDPGCLVGPDAAGPGLVVGRRARSPGSDLSARSGRLPELCAGADHRDGRRGDLVWRNDVTTRRPSRPIEDAEELAAETIDRLGSSIAATWWSRWPAATVICCGIINEADVPVLGIEGSARLAHVGAARVGHSDADRAVLARSGAAARSLRPAGRRRSRSSCLGRRRRSERICGRIAHVAQARRRGDRRGALCSRHGREGRIRHDLSRASLLFFAAVAAWPCSAGTVWS